MRHFTASLRLLMAGSLMASAAACQGEAARPRPDQVTTPETVGVATSFDAIACGIGRFHLDTGESVELRDIDCQAGVRPREMFVGASSGERPASGERWENGPLMVFGSDEQGQWYAAAGDVWQDGSCYQVYGGGAYQEGASLQFPSGLRLPLAKDFEMNREPEDAFPLHNSDFICLDRTATVISAMVTWGI
jgi:hypothetical protein